MSDNVQRTRYQDRDDINTLDDDEVSRQAKELGVTPEILKDTVNRVGVLKEDVRQHLGR